MGKGLFKEHTRVAVTFDTKPALNDKVWIDQTTGLIYNYDNTREFWLSASKHRFEFARKGSANGMYIPLLGDLDDSEDVYMPAQESMVTSISCRSNSGNKDQGFEIRKNGSLLYEFYYDGTKRRYVNNSLSFSISVSDRIQVYVKKQGQGVKNTVCRVETAWRYDI